MSQTYTIAQVVTGPQNPPRQWNSTKGGPMLAHKIILQEHPGQEVEWSRSEKSDAPATGQKIEGTIDWTNKFGARFQTESKGGGGGYARSPQESARITRQHSQEMALRLLAQTDTFKGWDVGSADREFKKAAMDLIQGITDWFQRDVERGVQFASYGQPQQSQVRDTERTGQSDIPAPAPEDFKHPEGVPTEEVPF